MNDFPGDNYDGGVAFPPNSPYSQSWRTIALMLNPDWHWWCFWRPKVIFVPVERK